MDFTLRTADEVDLRERPLGLDAWLWFAAYGIFVTRRRKLKPVVVTEAIRIGRQLTREEARNIPLIQETIRAEVGEIKERLPYTLEDLQKARNELERWREAYANDMSGNINKFRSEIENARDLVDEIEEDLKFRGVIEMSAQEKLDDELDRLYPDAKSRTVVTHAGNKYEIRYFPRRVSRSGKTVKEWRHQWVIVEEGVRE